MIVSTLLSFSELRWLKRHILNFLIDSVKRFMACGGNRFHADMVAEGHKGGRDDITATRSCRDRRSPDPHYGQ